MHIWKGIHTLPRPLNGSVFTLGNFDGVHLGHRKIISKLLDCAQKNPSLESVVFTFHPHPRKILNPQSSFTRLFHFDDQIHTFKTLKIHHLVIEPFTRDLSLLSPEDFLLKFIVPKLQPKIMIAGYDFTFGKERTGTLEHLKDLLKKLDIQLIVEPPAMYKEKIISSTQIKKQIQQGEVSEANSLLGRSFYISGIVVKGDGRGTSIGFPTANIKTETETYPKPGVYYGRVKVREKYFDAISNIGYCPTFKHSLNTIPKIEVHLLNFNENLYGKTITFEFTGRIRDEMSFPSAEKLSEQIEKDIDFCINLNHKELN